MKPPLFASKFLFLFSFLTLAICGFATAPINYAHIKSHAPVVPAGSLHRDQWIKKGAFAKKVLYIIGLKSLKVKKPSVTLAIIANFLIIVLLFIVFFLLSYGGATIGAYIIGGIFGAALLLLGISRLIWAIKRKKSKSNPNPNPDKT